MTISGKRGLKPDSSLFKISQWATDSQISILIISADGEVLLSKSMSENGFQIEEGDKVVKIRKLTGEPIESNWVKDFLFLDLEIDGEQAHLIVFENIDNHTSMGFPLNLPKIDSLLSIMPGVAYQCRNDKNWTIMYLSEGCFQLTGYNPEDLISNKKLAFADLIPKISHSSFFIEFKILQENIVLFRNKEKVYSTKTGS
jgi:PAS domain-containing protein